MLVKTILPYWFYLNIQPFAIYQVVCTQLGYFGGTVYGNARYGQGSGPIVAYDYGSCQGDEQKLSECTQPHYATSYCIHYEDVGVQCSECQFKKVKS